jgi:hypothetical protein
MSDEALNALKGIRTVAHQGIRPAEKFTLDCRDEQTPSGEFFPGPQMMHHGCHRVAQALKGRNGQKQGGVVQLVRNNQVRIYGGNPAYQIPAVAPQPAEKG